jgi:hypothetical protein
LAGIRNFLLWSDSVMFVISPAATFAVNLVGHEKQDPDGNEIRDTLSLLGGVSSASALSQFVMTNPTVQRYLINVSVGGVGDLGRVHASWTGAGRWNHAQIQHQLAGLIAFVGAIQHQGKSFRHGSQLFPQGLSFRRILRVAGRQSERYDPSSIHGNQMNLSIPSATGFSQWPVVRLF